MNNNEQLFNATIGGDSLIKITSNDNSYPNSKILGYGNNTLVIDYDPSFHSIISIECMYSDEIVESIYDIAKYSKLKATSTPILKIDPQTYNELNSLYFLLVYNHNTLNIIFKNKDDITGYYTSGRVDFYYDKDNYICGVRIRNLTKEEYTILKHEELDPGYYMKNTKKR